MRATDVRARRSPLRYRWGWPHSPEALNIITTPAAFGVNAGIYAAVIGVFALPAVQRAIGIGWSSVVAVLGAHVLWLAVSGLVLATRARTSKRAFDIQVIGNVLTGTVLATAFPVLGGSPATVLWGLLILYATANGSIAQFEPSVGLQVFHIGVPLATIPIFQLRGASDWSVAGPVLAAAMAASGYHLAASMAGHARHFRQAAISAEHRAAELRLARDLHDVIGSTLGTVKVYADMMSTSVPTVALPLSDLAQHGLDDLRGVLDALAPVGDAGLASTLDGIARRIVPPAIAVDVSGDARADVPGPLRVAVARIAQEALYNAVCHGKPTQIEISYHCTDSELRLDVRDNGVGFDTAADADGRGLTTMQARATELAGSFTIRSGKDGTAISAAFPLIRRAA